jgi:protein MpaA
MDVNLESTGFYSTQGRPIMISRFAQLGGITPTGRVLLIGGVHGDELSSVSIVFEWMEYLRAHHDGEFVWNVVPVMNPDGLFEQEPSRTNANGVDLNRNLPTADWQNAALAYWRDKADSTPRKFPGPAAGSEPETRWLMDEIDTFQPDMIITVHAPYNLIDYDAPSRKNAPRRFGLLKGGLLGTYPGSLGNYAGVKRGIPVVTIELPSSNKAMSIIQAHDMWSDMVEWLEKTIPLENQRFSQKRFYVEAKK